MSFTAGHSGGLELGEGSSMPVQSQCSSWQCVSQATHCKFVALNFLRAGQTEQMNSEIVCKLNKLYLSVQKNSGRYLNDCISKLQAPN